MALSTKDIRVDLLSKVNHLEHRMSVDCLILLTIPRKEGATLSLEKKQHKYFPKEGVNLIWGIFSKEVIVGGLKCLEIMKWDLERLVDSLERR